MNKDELFQEIDGGRPTPEQAAMLLNMAQGDTSAFMLDGDVPTVAAAPGADDGAGDAGAAADDQAGKNESDNGLQGAANAGAGEGGAQPGKEPGAAELSADNAVILARDGKHTISYDKLVEARQGEQHWKTEAAAKDARIAELEAQATARAQAGAAPTTTDNQLAAAQAAMEQGVDPELFGDFSEEALAAGIQKLIDAKVDARVNAIVEQKLAPIQQKHATDAEAEHFNAIHAVHPNSDSVLESTEFAGWVASRPPYEQRTIESIVKSGSAADVIDMLNSFKAATGKAPQAEQQPSAEGARAAAKQVLDNAKPEPPASLSDIPGGKPATGNRFEAISQMDPASMSDALRGMSPDQVEAFLNRTM